MKWFKASRKKSGWLALTWDGRSFEYAHGCQTSEGKPSVSLLGRADIAHGATPEKLVKELRVDRYNCATLLRAGEYQMLAVEAPAVMKEELKSAIRWKVKDMIDYRIEDAVVDFLDIPTEPGSAGRAHPAYAVAARSEVIRDRVNVYERAHVPLSVIDIPETAQRNISALCEPDGRGVALLYLDDQFGLLTITFRKELYFSRRIEIGLSQLLGAGSEARPDLFARIMLELQRTFDHFDRQFNFVPLAKLLLGPEPDDTGLLEYLRANMDTTVERVELTERVDFPVQSSPDTASQWRLFHLIGASLRHEEKAH